MSLHRIRPQTESSLLSDKVYEQLRRLIVVGDLQPGTGLPLMELSKKLGVSSMPVRQALDRLQSEGLVDQEPHKGSAVATIDPSDLYDVQAIRAGLEGIASRLAIPRIDDETVETMQSLLEELRKASEPSSFFMLEDELHLTLYSASARPQLIKMVKQHRRRAERYVRIAFRSVSGLTESIQFQEQLIAACGARAQADAQDIIYRGLEWTVEKVAVALNWDRYADGLTLHW